MISILLVVLSLTLCELHKSGILGAPESGIDCYMAQPIKSLALRSRLKYYLTVAVSR